MTVDARSPQWQPNEERGVDGWVFLVHQEVKPEVDLARRKTRRLGSMH
jgi:hypothetical protein